MSTIPYVQRLQELQTTADNQKAMALGLPLERPQQQEDPKEMLGIPQEEKDPLAGAMDTQFGKNLNKFSGKDVRFQEMMQEYVQLANGLRAQVQAGYMPEPIARKRLEQFVGDSGNHFRSNAAKPTDNPEIRGMLESALSQGGPQGGMPPQGVPQGMPQGGAPMPEGQPAPAQPLMGGM